MTHHLDAYLANLSAERGLSEQTLTAYRYDLTQFVDFLHRKNITQARAVMPGHVCTTFWRPCAGLGLPRPASPAKPSR